MTQEAYKHAPYDVEVEQALLGAVLADNARMDRVSALVRAETFYDPLHSRIWENMGRILASGRSVTPLTLHAEMKADPGIIETGGQRYLDGLRASAPSMPNVLDFANILGDLAVRRGLVRIGQEMVEAAYEPPEARFFERVQSQAMDGLMRLGVAALAPSALAEDVGHEVVRRAERAAAGEKPPAVPTGSELLDNAIGGMQGADLIIIAGRAGMGKSALMGGISLQAAMSMCPTLVISLEMRASQWVERNITDLDFDDHPYSPLAYQSFRKGNFTSDELSRVVLANGRLTGLPLKIIDTSAMTIQDIGARARAFKSEMIQRFGAAPNGQPLMGLIVVDYLQIIEPTPGRERGREQEVAGFARGLKQLAKALDWPVMAGAQLLNKGADPKAVNKEQVPNLAMIRESGAIEQEADIIMAPHRKSWFMRKSKPDLPHDDPEMSAWEADFNACKHLMKVYGLKFRHGEEYDLDLFCDMRSSSVRDERPYRGSAGTREADRAAAELFDAR